MRWCWGSLRRGGCWRRRGRLGNATTKYTKYTEGFWIVGVWSWSSRVEMEVFSERV